MACFQWFGMLELLGFCCDGVGDGDACQPAAVRERIVVDCSNGVGRAIVSDRLGNGHTAGILIVILIAYFPSIGDFGFVAVDVVVDAIHFEVVGGGGGWQEEC